MTRNTRTSTVTDQTRTAARAPRPRLWGKGLGRLTVATLALAAPLAVGGTALAGSADATIPAHAFTLSSHRVAFGSVYTGSSVTKSVTLTNTGSKPLRPLEIKSGSREFSVGGTCIGARLAHGAMCSLTLKFSPNAAGAATGSVRVLSVQGTPAQSVALSGTGIVQMMQSYNYLYTFANPPAINGVAAPQSFQGSGFARAGAYAMGETIPVYDASGLNLIGTYRIGAVSSVPLVKTEQNTVTVNTYTWGTNRYVAGTGLSSNTGTTGLGSESGSVLGQAFNDHNPAIHPSHW